MHLCIIPIKPKNECFNSNVAVIFPGTAPQDEPLRAATEFPPPLVTRLTENIITYYNLIIITLKLFMHTQMFLHSIISVFTSQLSRNLTALLLISKEEESCIKPSQKNFR